MRAPRLTRCASRARDESAASSSSSRDDTPTTTSVGEFKLFQRFTSARTRVVDDGAVVDGAMDADGVNLDVARASFASFASFARGMD